MSDELRDQPNALRFIRGLGYEIHAEKLSTVARVADHHALTEDEARAALVDLGLIFLANNPYNAHKCMIGLAVLRQGDPEDGA